jgi:type IV pilus assembly protein PilO
MTMTRKWSALAVVAALAILAAGWFLLISPKRGEAADLHDKAAAQDQENARLQQKLSILIAQQKNLPQQRAKLAEFRVHIPDNPALPTLIRDLTAAGRKVGVSIDTMAPSLPEAVVADVTTPVAQGTTTATTAPASTGGSLYQVPLTLDVSGSYFELEQFLNKLEGLRRSMLVTGFTLGAADSTAGSTAGDLRLSLNGRVFMSPELTTTTAPAAAAAGSAATTQ